MFEILIVYTFSFDYFHSCSRYFSLTKLISNLRCLIAQKIVIDHSTVLKQK